MSTYSVRRVGEVSNQTTELTAANLEAAFDAWNRSAEAEKRREAAAAMRRWVRLGELVLKLAWWRR